MGVIEINASRVSEIYNGKIILIVIARAKNFYSEILIKKMF